VAYEYEIFLSYRRSPTVGLWVTNHLMPRLQARLDEVGPDVVRICGDFHMESGVRWPDQLKRQLRVSGLLVAVWSADYFRSSWCMAEWRSFREREQMLGLFTPGRPQGLIYPIRYADGEHFHPEALLAQCNKDFSRLNYPDDVFRQSPKYIEFDEIVQEMSQELVGRLQSLPPWSADFPIIEPVPLQPPRLPRPVL
jgi:TIR domain-containing protein